MQQDLDKIVQKKLSFRDFLTVDYTPGMPEQISWNAKKRKRGVMGPTDESYEPVGEALNFAQRRIRGIIAKRNKAKLKMGRQRAERRTASPEKLMKRARKMAINILFKKFSKGVPRSDLPPSRKQEIETRLEKMKGRIDRIARKLLPAVRKLERERRMGSSADQEKE